MSLVVQAFHEFTRDVPLAMGLLTAFCIAFALEVLVIVAPRTESMERPMLGRLEFQIPTAARAWLGTPAVIAPDDRAPAITMKIGDYPDYGTFIRELVRRRQGGVQVTLGLP